LVSYHNTTRRHNAEDFTTVKASRLNLYTPYILSIRFWYSVDTLHPQAEDDF